MKKKNIDSNQRLLITQQEMVLIKNSDEATNVDLHIGSDCVRNFTDIMGIKQQKKRLSQLKKEQEQQKMSEDSGRWGESEQNVMTYVYQKCHNRAITLHVSLQK